MSNDGAMASEGAQLAEFLQMAYSNQSNRPACCADFENERDGSKKVFVVRISGNWLLSEDRPSPDELLEGYDLSKSKFSRFDIDNLESWDSSLLIFLRRCQKIIEENGATCRLGELPKGIRNLIELSHAVPEETREVDDKTGGWLTHLGERSWRIFSGMESYASFLGVLLLEFFAFVVGRAKIRKDDFFSILQNSGPKALPIVCLLSFLTGLIIAFIGVIQLQKFAADIYVADLVGLATTRELGAVMAGVIMAGRTGAAFAAQLGSMRVNEEIDALITFDISPMQFLVLPRVLALMIMMPLLCVCANLVAILGGLVVAVSISDVSVTKYIYQIDYAVGSLDLFVGIFKSIVFGIIIAVAGCFRGLNCGKDATAVGLAATSAVVTAITWIVVADAIFAVLFHILGV